MDDLNYLDLSKLTPEQVAGAKLLAYRAASWAIDNAITKFTPEQQAKIHAAAFRSFLEKTLAEGLARSLAYHRQYGSNPEMSVLPTIRTLLNKRVSED
ncbi:hypothetical protein [Edaphobacter bradus]|uniref:hypothetical protein n=1 Tax=Edaphobacter bradus TaxID=2259016 RepID=UPI0021E0F4A6|nr:hypothetical protein [Edaphobacter bradus]